MATEVEEEEEVGRGWKRRRGKSSPPPPRPTPPFAPSSQKLQVISLLVVLAPLLVQLETEEPLEDQLASGFLLTPDPPVEAPVTVWWRSMFLHWPAENLLEILEALVLTRRE